MRKLNNYFLSFMLLLILPLTMVAQNEEDLSQFQGTLYLNDGTTVEGKFIGKFRDGFVPKSDDYGNTINLDAGKEAQKIVHFYPYKKRFKYQTYKAKDAQKFVISENEIYDVINYKPGAISTSLDLGKMASAASEHFVKRIYKSEVIGIYKSSEEYIFYKEGEKAGLATSTLGFQKKLAKLTSDCPEISEKISNKEYKGIDQFIEFAKEYTSCKKGN